MKRGTFATIASIFPLLALPSSAPLASVSFPDVKIDRDSKTGSYVVTVRGENLPKAGDDRWRAWAADPTPGIAEKLKHLSEDEMDLARLELELERELDPKVNVEGYSHQIDVMVEDVRKLAGGTRDPARR